MSDEHVERDRLKFGLMGIFFMGNTMAQVATC